MPGRPFPRARGTRSFTVVFYGVKCFLCKTAQLCATRRESEMAGTPSVRNGAQGCENARKKSFLNYTSSVDSVRKGHSLRTADHAAAEIATILPLAALA